MSGIEVLSLILGIVPLIIEAFDHSDSVAKGILTLKKQCFAREIRNLSCRINNQRSIFRATAFSVRDAIIEDRNGVTQQLELHLLRGPGDFNASRGNIKDSDAIDSLKDLLISCEATLNEIFRRIPAITDALGPFRTPQMQTHHTMSWVNNADKMQTPVTDMKTRFHLAWNRSGIDQQIKELKDFNNDSILMGKNIVRLLNDDQKPLSNSSKQGSQLGRPLEASLYKHIQHASLRLYRTMSEKWHCGAHEGHMVHLHSPWRLERYLGSDLVSLVMIITPDDNDPTQFHGLRLEVQHYQCVVTASTASPKPPTPKPSTPKYTNSIGIMNQPPLGLDPMHSSAISSLTSALEKGAQGWMPETRPYEANKLKKRPKFSQHHENIPLEDLQLNSDPREDSTFYSSPWLPDRLESNNFRVLGKPRFDETELSYNTHSLFVSLEFGKGSKGKGVAGANRKPLGEHAPQSPTSHTTDVGIRNERLFCLGVVLLELGYTMAWETLRSSIMERLPLHQKSDYFAAERLARGLVSRMGPSYVRIIRKCIGCDFGLGETDLGDEDLQRKFAEDVIIELRNMRKGLATLWQA
ncbi:hypothetical protein M426DRAFT_27270 [Hypoxylon sp. CI-4A]|nr:hypothetical protein M426DRAFT_27270 [Hypoxylon sp. CI-4A]